MFDLKRPCVTCPFRKGQGELFQMSQERIEEIVEATAFQCHKTVNYSGVGRREGDNPQQCAGLMAVLNRENRPNQIMQVAVRLDALDTDALDPADEAYASLSDVYQAHGK